MRHLVEVTCGTSTGGNWAKGVELGARIHYMGTQAAVWKAGFIWGFVVGGM
jgi:hypothetical protein